MEDKRFDSLLNELDGLVELQQDESQAPRRTSDFDLSLREVNVEKRQIKIRASTKNVVRGDAILPSAWKLERYRKNPVIMWAHDYTLPPIGKSLWTKTDEDGLLQLLQFAETDFAEEILTLYSDGYLNAWSVGYAPLSWLEPDDEDFNKVKKEYGIKGKPRWITTGAELFETSAVPIPADPDAISLAIQDGLIRNRSLIRSLDQELQQRRAQDENEQIHSKLDKLIEQFAAFRPTAENAALALGQLQEINRKIDELSLRQEFLNSLIHKPEPEPKKTAGISADDLRKAMNEAISGEISRIKGRVK